MGFEYSVESVENYSERNAPSMIMLYGVDSVETLKMEVVCMDEYDAFNAGRVAFKLFNLMGIRLGLRARVSISNHPDFFSFHLEALRYTWMQIKYHQLSKNQNPHRPVPD